MSDTRVQTTGWRPAEGPGIEPGLFLMTVRCPFCGREHLHGAFPGDGWTSRVPDCPHGEVYLINEDDAGNPDIPRLRY